VREREKVGGVRRRVVGVPVAGGNGEWRLVGGGCLFLELRRAESPHSCEGERMVCFEQGVGGDGCRDRVTGRWAGVLGLNA